MVNKYGASLYYIRYTYKLKDAINILVQAIDSIIIRHIHSSSSVYILSRFIRLRLVVFLSVCPRLALALITAPKQRQYLNEIDKKAILSPCRSFADGVRGPDIDRIFVFWSPEACIADSMTDDGLSKVVSGNTQVSQYAGLATCKYTFMYPSFHDSVYIHKVLTTIVRGF